MTKKRYKYLVSESQLNYFLESASSGKLVVYDFYKGLDGFIQAFIKDPIGTPLNDFIKTNYPELDKKTLIKKLVDENILNKEVIVDDSVLAKSKVKFSLPQKGYYEKTKRLFNLMEKEKETSKVEENASSPYDINVKYDDRIYIARNKKDTPLSQGAVDNVVTYSKIVESTLNKLMSESHLLTEEITRTEVKDEIEKYIKSSDFLNNIKKVLDAEFKKSKVMEDKMVEIASNVLVQLYKSLWTKRGFWKGDLKNSAS
jgi:hypothetical protein